jgi:hypothetical protein
VGPNSRSLLAIDINIRSLIGACLQNSQSLFLYEIYGKGYGAVMRGRAESINNCNGMAVAADLDGAGLKDMSRILYGCYAFVYEFYSLNCHG